MYTESTESSTVLHLAGCPFGWYTYLETNRNRQKHVQRLGGRVRMMEKSADVRATDLKKIPGVGTNMEPRSPSEYKLAMYRLSGSNAI